MATHMSNKSIAIIGAGIAGLSAGCYAQMNGYSSEIFEMNSLPGGLCTSWRRGPYVFDGCLEWLVGTAPNSSMRVIWNELGALEGRRIVDHSEFRRIVEPGGKTFIVYNDIARLEQHMKELAPDDTALIDELLGALRRLSRFDAPAGKPPELYSLFDKLRAVARALPYIATFRKYNRITVEDFAARFRDPFLRRALPLIADLPGIPMLVLLLVLIWQLRRDAGYLVGGSLEFAHAIERRYLQLGGKIHYGARVEKIIVENGRAAGVRLAGAGHFPAHAVISAADGHATIFEMLEGKYVDDEIRGYYQKLPVFAPLIQVSLGVGADLSGYPPKTLYLLDRPMEIAGEQRSRLAVKHYCCDPTMAPAGKSVLVVLFSSRYDYWKALAADRQRYEAEKRQVAETTIARLETFFPEIRGRVEEVDVATPMTYERYTGNWQGSFEGWMLSAEAMRLMMRGGMKKTLPGLENFYMAGQWVMPGGGLPPAAMSGRGVIAMLSKRDGKPFSSSSPPAHAATG